MFPRGPRFEPQKISDVPGPGAYNPEQQSALDNYKRGAFLEKADRFAKEKMPIGAPASKTSPTQSPAERYAALQRKVENLEKVHLEGKKSHNIELEKLKQELALSQKQASDHADKLDKQKKQKSSLETTVQELKKSALSDQGEIKDLRHKVRLLEMEREKACAKLPETAELKKAVQALETKRKDDLRERDRRIADLEKNLQAEKKKREQIETKFRECKRVAEEEVQIIKNTALSLDAQLVAAKTEMRLANDKLSEVESRNTHQEHELLQQLEQHRSLLNSVAQQYGALASQSASLASYKKLQREYAALQCRQFRLERKLANSEGQIVELAQLIRQVKEQNLHLGQQMAAALEEVLFLRTTLPASASTSEEDTTSHALVDIHNRLCDESAQVSKSDNTTHRLLATYYQLKSSQLSFASSVLAKEHVEAMAVAEQRESDLSSALASHEAIAARLESFQREKAASQEALERATIEASKLGTTVTDLEIQLADVQQKLDGSHSIHAIALKKEKDTIQRLTSTIQKHRMAEEALRADIDQLSRDLTNAEGYETAYCQLYEQVGSLIARKQIAEEEANRISKFNAEILGHNNPAQRIMYVDRIRTELAEAKMKIAELTREQENVAAQNDELLHELDMYKSVRVPLENKPRTNLTRVGRPPLVNLTHSVNNASVSRDSSAKSHHGKPAFTIIEPVMEVSHGDMTLDEIM